VGAVAKLVGGSGGGKPEIAEAGGKDQAQIDAALQVALNLNRNRVVAGNAVAVIIWRLVVASRARQIRVQRRRSNDGYPDLEREGPVTAFAGYHVAPASGDGEGRLGSVQAQCCVSAYRSGASSATHISRIVRIAGRIVGCTVQGEAGSGGHSIGCGELVAVIDQHAGTDAPSEPGGVIIQRHAG
jgi:hypothetical protein